MLNRKSQTGMHQFVILGSVFLERMYIYTCDIILYINVQDWWCHPVILGLLSPVAERGTGPLHVAEPKAYLLYFFHHPKPPENDMFSCFLIAEIQFVDFAFERNEWERNCRIFFVFSKKLSIIKFYMFIYLTRRTQMWP